MAKKRGILKKGKKAKPVREEAKVDLSKVDAIVSRMQSKYAKRGLAKERVKGERLEEIRGLIAGAGPGKITVQTAEELKDAPSPVVKSIGKIHSALGGLFYPIGRLLSRLSLVKKLDYNLYSAYIKYSATQWLAMTSVVAFLVAIVTFVLLTSFSFIVVGLPYTVVFSSGIMLSVALFIFSALIMLLIPSNRAKARAAALNVELPFALRHMGTELRAGIGLYKTLQTIAVADYGVLSEEFARTITEIEEGTDTKDALAHFAMRTKSKAMRSALMHIIRALKTGGNLSEIMNIIASDVAFELRMKMRDFAEKMNFFGVIFIFIGIVLPVFVAILGAISNAPLGAMFTKILPLDVTIITVFYGVFMPLILALLILYLKTAQPRV